MNILLNGTNFFTIGLITVGTMMLIHAVEKKLHIDIDGDGIPHGGHGGKHHGHGGKHHGHGGKHHGQHTMSVNDPDDAILQEHLPRSR